MFSRFFIERPIFATVLAIVIVLAGLISVAGLPVAQYPDITPPTVQVTAAYPGANAVVVSETVAAPIEQEVNGVEGMIYMSSISSNDGSYALTVSFEVGVDLDMASVLVQNRVAIAQAKLPEEVMRQGVTTKKKSTAIVQLISLTSPDDRYDNVYLANYATLPEEGAISHRNTAGDIRRRGQPRGIATRCKQTGNILTKTVYDLAACPGMQAAKGVRREKRPLHGKIPGFIRWALHGAEVG